ncbi:MAG: uncharacterized protein A8A55_3120, partial [Amphiamblys sp. WSBS2006]
MLCSYLAADSKIYDVQENGWDCFSELGDVYLYREDVIGYRRRMFQEREFLFFKREEWNKKKTATTRCIICHSEKKGELVTPMCGNAGCGFYLHEGCFDSITAEGNKAASDIW